MTERKKTEKKTNPIAEFASAAASAVVVIPVLIIDGIFTAINT